MTMEMPVAACSSGDAACIAHEPHETASAAALGLRGLFAAQLCRVRWSGQAQVLTQRAPGVGGAKQPTPLQFRDHQCDKILQIVG